MALEYYARRVLRTRGMEHLANLNLLRNYIKATSEKSLILQIKRITDFGILRILWEAGLTAPLQSAVLRRTRELELRRG